MSRMKKVGRIWLMATLFAGAAGYAQAQECSVAVVSPSPNGKVAEADTVTGPAALPADTYLWVFTHRKGVAMWWPQGGTPATVSEGSFTAPAYFGTAAENGMAFEIAVAVVDKQTNEKLLQYSRKAASSGQYPGMDFPATVRSCKVERMMVTKR